jgi:hypothetical protein
MDTEALPAALRDHPLVLRAVEDLKMLTQTDLEREGYEARRKAQLDYNTGLKVARMEGRDEGEKLGIIQAIHALERLLKRGETARQHLLSLSLEDLIRLTNDLETELHGRG